MIATLRRALRGIREHLYFTAVSVGVIATAVVLIGMFVLVSRNLRTVVGAWEEDAHVSAYFKAELPAEGRAAVQAQVAARPEVAAVTLVTEPEARAWLVQRTPELAPMLDTLGGEVLPASLEITLRPDWTDADRVAAFATSLGAMGAWEDVDFGQEWVARFHTFLSLFRVMGAVLGTIIAVATLFLVGNTIHLVVHARRDELEIMRLVGASDGFILGPFLVEGAVHGVCGASLGLLVLWGIHEGVVVRAHALLALAMGEPAPGFVGAGWVVGLFLAGVALGVAAAWGAVGRFLARLP